MNGEGGNNKILTHTHEILKKKKKKKQGRGLLRKLP